MLRFCSNSDTFRSQRGHSALVRHLAATVSSPRPDPSSDFGRSSSASIWLGPGRVSGVSGSERSRNPSCCLPWLQAEGRERSPYTTVCALCHIVATRSAATPTRRASRPVNQCSHSQGAAASPNSLLGDQRLSEARSNPAYRTTRVSTATGRLAYGLHFLRHSLLSPTASALLWLHGKGNSSTNREANEIVANARMISNS